MAVGIIGHCRGKLDEVEQLLKQHPDTADMKVSGTVLLMPSPDCHGQAAVPL